MYLLMIRGNAFIPQRFWDCRLMRDNDYEEKKRLEKLGYRGRRASATEVKRGVGQRDYCLGDIADHFNK